MKVFLINILRVVIYTAYIAIIAYGVLTGIYNSGYISAHLPGIAEGSAISEYLDIGIGFLAGWIVASITCGMIVTVLDIRDDINDRLPDARKQS